jgi:NTP pyrophosphatase (non-canonical NTP hydrolase)
LLQVLFHSVVAEERGAFDFGDVAEGFLRKMKARIRTSITVANARAGRG